MSVRDSFNREQKHFEFEQFAQNLESRSPEIRAAFRKFDYGTVPSGLQRRVAAEAADLAIMMMTLLNDSVHLLNGLHRLWDARNHFIYQAASEEEATREIR